MDIWKHQCMIQKEILSRNPTLQNGNKNDDQAIFLDYLKR